MVGAMQAELLLQLLHAIEKLCPIPISRCEVFVRTAFWATVAGIMGIRISVVYLNVQGQ